MLSWDAHHYLQIAAHGYPAIAPQVGGHLTFDNAAFEPLFPLLIRLVSLLNLSLVTSGVIVSVAGGLAAVYFMWRLATAVTNEETGLSAALLFVVLPGIALAWGLLYSECVGLALVAASLFYMTQKRWLLAGCIGALATLTDPIALALVVAAGWPLLAGLRHRTLSKSWVCVALVPTGFLSYAAWLAIRYHDALFWWHLQQQGWGAQIDWGRSLLALLPHWTRLGGQGPAWMEWIGVVLVLGALVSLAVARLPGEINAYCIGVLALLFVTNDLGFKPRLLTWAFPALIAVAATLPRPWRRVVSVLFTISIPVFFILYSTMGNSVAQP